MRKAEIELRMRRYCQGCGVSFNIGIQLGPREWEPPIFIAHFERAMNELDKVKCEYCGKSTQQISIYEDPES